MNKSKIYKKKLIDVLYQSWIFKTIYFVGGCTGLLWLCAGFLWSLQVGAALNCGAWAFRCSGFSCCGVLSVHTLSSRGVQALGTGSGVVAHGLSCFLGMWNLPGPGIKPMSSAMAGRFLFTVPPWKSSKLKTFALWRTLLGKKKILLEWKVSTC